MAEIQLTQEQQNALAARNPVPTPRTSEAADGTLGVSAPSAQPAAQPGPDTAAVDREKWNKREQELVDAAKAKDRALEERRAERDALQAEVEKLRAAQPKDDVPLEDQMVNAAKQAGKDAATATMQGLQPLLEQAAEAKQEREVKKAGEIFSEEDINRYRAEAEEQRKRFPGMTLPEALQIVVPRAKAPDTPVPTNPPGTHVEAGRTAAPAIPETRAGKIQQLNQEAAELCRRGQTALGEKKVAEALALRMFGSGP